MSFRITSARNIPGFQIHLCPIGFTARYSTTSILFRRSKAVFTVRQAVRPFETLIDPHASMRMKRNLTDGWFFGILPDMNTENPVVEQYLLQNSIWWAETSGLDGFRIDTFPYVGRKFWANWHSGLRRLYPSMTTIGEVFHPDPTVTSFFVGGERRYDGIDTGLSTVFDFPMLFTLREVLMRNAPTGRSEDRR